MEQINSFYSSEISLPKNSKKQKPHSHKYREDYNSGYRVCIECGYVSPEILFSPYFPYNDQNQDHKLSQKGYYPKKPISSRLNRAFKLEKKIPWNEKKISLGKMELEGLVARQSLPKSILNRSFYLFQKICKHPSFKTHYIRLMVQVCLYYAAKAQGCPVILEDIIDRNQFSLSLAQRYYYLLIRTLNLPNISLNLIGFVARFGTKLGLDESLIQETNQLILQVQSLKNFSGYDNRGVAAGALYFVCILHRIPCSQKLIAKIAKISEITIRNRYKEIQSIYSIIQGINH